MSELPARRRIRERKEREARERAAAAAAAGSGAGAGDVVTAAAAPPEDGDFAASGGGEAYYEDDDAGSTAAEANQDAWKTFGADTEAGRLLKKLYGDNTKPTIKYPKVRTAPRGPARPFVPAGGKADVDARKPKKHSNHVNVPRVNGGYSPRKLTMIEYSEMCGGRRKRGAEIEAELKVSEAERDRYRPMPTKAKSTPLEKQRLQNINMFKGGKGLPDELTLAPIKGQIPLSMMTDPKKAKKFVPRRKKAASAAPAPPKRSDAEVLFDKISDEVDERMEFMAAMRKLGKAEAKKHEAVVRGEIAQRTVELERLHAIIQAEKKENASRA